MTTTTATDALTELLRLVEREHQRIETLERELAKEQRTLRALSNRVDDMERSTP